MKITLGTIIKESPALQNLLTVKLPVKIAYRLTRLDNKLTPILKAYNEKRNELVIEYGEEKEKGQFNVTDPEKLKIFMEKITELQEVEEEVDFLPLKVEDLGEISIEPINLPAFIFE